MWCDVQSPAMMGLHAATNKRKLDDQEAALPPPAKQGRTASAETARDAALGLSTDLDDWRLGDSTSSVLATALLRTTMTDDEGEEEGKLFPCVRYGSDNGECYSSELKNMSYYGGSHEDQGYGGGPAARGGYWGQGDYYPAGSQQTIRCEENGKSYLDLGSSNPRYAPPPNSVSVGGGGGSKCCDLNTRTNWCSRGPACYRQRRLAVLNISMCKLGRYRQFPDPSLRRSVLICNTLRYIEREMEHEGFFFNNGGSSSVPPPAAPQPAPAYQHQQPQFPPEVPVETTYQSPAYRGAELTPQYEQSLRDLSSSGRATPFPSSSYDTDSGLGDEDSGRSINWGSVLSLSNQSDLDPLNNNELYPPNSTGDTSSLGLLGDMDLGHEFDDFLPSWKLTPLSADDILKSVPSRPDGDLDSIMHVLVDT